jgi:hypothetical protein
VQAMPVPQVHAPLEEQPSANPAPHAAHVPPGAAQAAMESGVQTFPVQHPVGHEVESHTQVPPEQCSPRAHGAPVPHWQVPLAEHVSARTVSHATHVAPAAPQVPSARVLQVVPSQQPSGQDVESQTHWPARQRWPVVHTAPPPHVQAPAVHPSAAVPSHALHAAPAVPHVVADAWLQVSPEQQPLGHTQPLQTPPLHCSLAPQAAQA